MPIGKNSISRVAGEPAVESEKKTAAAETSAKDPKPAAPENVAAAKPATTAKTTKPRTTAATKASGSSAPKKSAPKKAAAPKTETVERIETVAKTVTKAAKPAPAKSEDVKAYVTITDELPTYLL
ncbi:MAG: hypothetical protein IJW40_06805 [Clostridia bacterium]|nr:hypothetical protein [Clostridia bacterium]